MFLHELVIQKYKVKYNQVRHIHIYYGNKVIGDIVNSNTNKISCSPNYVDEVWISPHYNIYKNYLKTFYNNEKIFIIPYIWESKFVKNLNFDISRNISILEPNLNITKHCMPAIMIANELHQQNSSVFDTVYVYCSKSIRKHRFFNSWLRHLRIYKDNKIRLMDRLPFVEILQNGPGVFLSHQLMNELNYMYLEALYLDIPLVHNSEPIKKTGYYYKQYDTKMGAQQLNLALQHHSNSHVNNQIKTETNKILNQYSPFNPKVINEYKKLFM